jgi:outer membrane protein OmpA-like peptidoglycan-associated protein
MTRKWLFMTWVLLLLGPAAFADDVSGRLGLGLETGWMKLIGGQNDFSNFDQQAGFRLQRGLTAHWSLELSLKYGWIRPGVSRLDGEAGWTTAVGEAFATVVWQPRAGILYHFAPARRLSPFLGLSLGGTAWQVRDLRGQTDIGLDPDGPVLFGFDESGRRRKLENSAVTATMTAGLDYFLSQDLAFNLGARFHTFVANDLDNVGLSHLFGPDAVDANTAMVEGFAGLTLFFGSADSDRDGIPNRQDRCPQAAEDRDMFEDDDGCPDPDNDRDGIVDARDGCPTAAEDLDGFQDDDGCPDPDNDGDGLADAEDQCPDEAEDADGYQDADGCPDPDDDGDGVLDAQDRCPNTPVNVAVDAHGCPAIAEITAALILKGVTFELGSAVLQPQSRTVLNEVAHSLLAYPDVTIEIRGHTDDVGSRQANRELSLRRATAVKDYLVQAGIGADRITSIGYGEDYPIAPNDTPEGRAQNRRVEIHRTDQ